MCLDTNNAMPHPAATSLPKYIASPLHELLSSVKGDREDSSGTCSTQKVRRQRIRNLNRLSIPKLCECVACCLVGRQKDTSEQKHFEWHTPPSGRHGPVDNLLALGDLSSGREGLLCFSLANITPAKPGCARKCFKTTVAVGNGSRRGCL